MCRGGRGRESGRRQGGGGGVVEGRAGPSRAGRGERGSGGAEAAQKLYPARRCPERSPPPFQCGVPLARARTGTAHAPQILNLHRRRPPWQPHMRVGRRGGGGARPAGPGGKGRGGRRTLGRLPPLRRARPCAHARPGGRSEGFGRTWKRSGGRRGFGVRRACAERPSRNAPGWRLEERLWAWAPPGREEGRSWCRRALRAGPRLAGACARPRPSGGLSASTAASPSVLWLVPCGEAQPCSHRNERVNFEE